MHAHVMDGDRIANTIIVDGLDSIPGLTLVDAAIGGAIGDRIVEGAVIPAEVPPAPPSDPAEPYRAAIQKMLDEKVKERRYYDILNACSYANSTNATFKAEAEACIAWRDAVWAKAYEALALVQSGAALQPTIPGLLAMLPTLTWPEV